MTSDTNAILIDGMFHTREMAVRGVPPHILIPLHKPLSLQFDVNTDPPAPSHEYAACFERLGRLPNDVVVYVLKGLGLHIWEIESSWPTHIDDRAVQEVAAEMWRSIDAISVAKVLALFDETTRDETTGLSTRVISGVAYRK